MCSWLESLQAYPLLTPIVTPASRIFLRMRIKWAGSQDFYKRQKRIQPPTGGIQPPRSSSSISFPVLCMASKWLHHWIFCAQNIMNINNRYIINFITHQINTSLPVNLCDASCTPTRTYAYYRLRRAKTGAGAQYIMALF